MPSEQSWARTTNGVSVLPPLMPNRPVALLALADGSLFRGWSIGVAGQTVGEVVFNTALTGYQEILTDPSYFRQIVTLTYPHIGNYGVSDEDIEAPKVQAAGLVIKDLPVLESSFRMTMTLGKYLEREGTVAIAGIDTRKLTRHLRTHGAQNGCIVALPAGAVLTPSRIDEAIAAARSAPSMAGLDLAQVVSVKEPYAWTETAWGGGGGAARPPPPPPPPPTSSPTTTASSATSCACWPSAAAGSPSCRRARRRPRCWR